MNDNQNQSSHGGRRSGAGRKKGSGQMSKYRAMLEPHAERLIQRVVVLANEGDMSALKLCLDRLCAPLRPTDRLIIIDGLKDEVRLSSKGDLILSHVAKGKITPSEASNLMNIIANQAKIIETAELEQRVEELEKKNAIGK